MSAGSGFAIIRANSRFRVLWVARTVSFAGDSLALIALLLYAAKTTGSALAVALLLLAGDTLPSFVSPLTGGISDRFDRRLVMISCDLTRGALILAIAVVQPGTGPLLVLVAAHGVIGRVFQPASQAVVPALVADSELEGGANAALGLGTNGLEVIGPGLAAIGLPVLGLRGVLLVDAISFFASAVLTVSLPRLPPPKKEGGKSHVSYLAEARLGIIEIWKRPAVRLVAVGFFLVVAFTGVDDVALVFLARSLGATQAAASLLYAGAGVGLLIGLFILARRPGLLPLTWMVVIGFALSSGGNLLTGLAGAIAVAFLTQIVRGIGLSLQDTGAFTMIQRLVPGDLHGRIFSNFFGAIGIAAGLSYMVAGPAVQRFGPRTVFIVAGAGGVISALAVAAGFVLSRSSPQEDVEP